MRNAIIISLACLILTSCSPFKRLNVSVEEEPEIKISSSLPEVAVLNMVASKESSRTYLNSEFFYSGAARDGSNAICEAFKSRLDKSGKFSMQNILYKGNDENKQRKPSPMNKSIAQSWCSDLHANVLFVVEYFFSDLKRDVSESSEDGKTMFVATLSGVVETSINIFVKNNNSEIQVLKPVNYSQNIDIKASGASKSEAKDNLEYSRDVVSSWGYEIGSSQADRFLAKTYNVKRDFYVGNINEFKQSFKLLKNGNTDEAMQLIMPLVTNKSKQICDQAWFNMALIAEVKGDRKKAIEYVSKSELREAYSYKSDLKALLGE